MFIVIVILLLALVIAGIVCRLYRPAKSAARLFKDEVSLKLDAVKACQEMIREAIRSRRS